jgi:cyclopropane fatty-acyl-phospholipid synthase-like methyltransferase
VLLKGLGLGSDSLVVEFGSGTGQFTVEVAPACAQVIAVDVSEPMLWDVVYDFAPAEAKDRIAAWCETGADTSEAEWSRAELEEHVRDERSTFTWLLEPMIERSGFQIEAAEHSEDGIFAKYLLRAA